MTSTMSDSHSELPDPFLRDLRVFVSVATTGSFRTAAERLFSSQPSVSRAIARLERQLGVRVLERGPRGAQLTEAGAIVLRHARQVGAQMASLRSDLDHERKHVLRLGAAATAAGSYLAPFLAEWIPAHPEVRVEVVEAGSMRLREVLAVGECDLAIVPLPMRGPFETVPLAAPRVRAFFPQGHQLDAEDGTVTVLEVTRFPVLMNSDGFIAGRQFLRACEANGRFPEIVYRSDMGQTLAALSEAGMGVAVFADSVSLRGFDLRSRVIVDSDGTELGFTLAAAWPKHSPQVVREFGHSLALYQQSRSRLGR